MPSRKNSQEEKSIAQSIALEAEEDVGRERDARKRHLQERLLKKKTKKLTSFKSK